MERKTLEAMLPEGTEKEVVDHVLNAMHGEIVPYKERAEKAEHDLAETMKEMKQISAQAKGAEDTLAALQTLQEKYDKDVRERDSRIAQIEFDNLLNGAIKEKNGRDAKSIRAHLDLDALKGSKNRESDIEKALGALAKTNDYLFVQQPTGQKVDVGPRIKSSGSTITKEEFSKMGYASRLKLYQEQPDVYQTLMGGKE